MNEQSGVSVKAFGAQGDGVTDDTVAIEAACKSGSGWVVFPQGVYVIKRPIVIDMVMTGRVRIFGAGATIRHEGPGPAIHLLGHHRASANPQTLNPDVYARTVMPVVDGVIIEGAHPQADGIRLDGTFKATLTALTVTGCRHGIHVVGLNRNILINGVHVYNNRGIGIYLDHVDLHQINISTSHISYNRGSGIMVEAGNIRNIQINGNDIEYNYHAGGSDIWFTAGPIGIREGAITGNTIQAIQHPGGSNVRIEGFQPGGRGKAGLLSITGNHISNQTVNIRIADSRGVVIGSNTVTRGFERNVEIVRSQYIHVDHNVLDDNPDYGENIVGGIYVEDSKHCTIHGVTMSGCHGGSMERGGSIEAIRCVGLLIDNCIVTGSAYRDVWLHDVRESKVSGLILNNTGEIMRLAAVVESGMSDFNMIVHNMVHATQGEAIQLKGPNTLHDGNMVFESVNRPPAGNGNGAEM